MAIEEEEEATEELVITKLSAMFSASKVRNGMPRKVDEKIQFVNTVLLAKVDNEL